MSSLHVAVITFYSLLGKICKNDFLFRRIKMTDKLYDNAGELTCRCLDSLLEGDYAFDDEDEMQEDYLHTYPCKTFADGLTDSIIAHGYNGDIKSIENKTAFILEKCAKNDISINRTNIKNWFKDKRPISGSRSRELVYLLCFALDFSLDDVIEFFMKVYFECPFNYRDHHEAIYYYCFVNHLNYSAAQKLIIKADDILESYTNEAPVLEYTHMIGSALKNINTKEELLAFIKKNHNEFFRNNQTAYQNAESLIDESCELAVKMYEIETIEHESRKINRKANIDLLLFQMLGADILEYKGEQSFAKAAEFPEIVKSNFPLKMQLSNIKNKKPVSYESIRKALILLNFYHYFASLFYENHKDKLFCSIEEDFRDFVYDKNDLLFSCGYPTLYIRNPYDWLFMHCAYNEYPLNEFKEAIAKYYTDIIEADF